MVLINALSIYMHGVLIVSHFLNYSVVTVYIYHKY